MKSVNHLLEHQKTYGTPEWELLGEEETTTACKALKIESDGWNMPDFFQRRDNRMLYLRLRGGVCSLYLIEDDKQIGYKKVYRFWPRERIDYTPELNILDMSFAEEQEVLNNSIAD